MARTLKQMRKQTAKLQREVIYWKRRAAHLQRIAEHPVIINQRLRGTRVVQDIAQKPKLPAEWKSRLDKTEAP